MAYTNFMALFGENKLTTTARYMAPKSTGTQLPTAELVRIKARTTLHKLMPHTHTHTHTLKEIPLKAFSLAAPKRNASYTVYKDSAPCDPRESSPRSLKRTLPSLSSRLPFLLSILQ